MGGMEFTWRMASTLAWPVVAIIVALVFRRWIIEKVSSVAVKAGPVDVELTLLDNKVDAVGQDISATLSDSSPLPEPDGAIPTSLVDLLSVVTENRDEGIRTAFHLVQQALKEHYPQLRGVPPQQLPNAMQRLVAKGEMEADLAWSVQQLYELLVMPEWKQDSSGDTRGYAFLMLAEGAIHGILRSKAEPSSPVPVETSWRGIYNDSYPIGLDITTRSDGRFDGTMTYPDDDTATSVTGTIEADDDGIRINWKEHAYTRRGLRPINFNGTYSAVIRGDVMEGGWYQGNRHVADFTMTVSGVTAP
ncbi:hypothetical protein ACIBG8_04135 [Nonomuraea sp. NPDC050556]|uniref:hypothetical protein n=1 Tax=Nonomuraea sp. NPDC050556 TaxID=3364369 RepID=UPI0037A49423